MIFLILFSILLSDTHSTERIAIPHVSKVIYIKDIFSADGQNKKLMTVIEEGTFIKKIDSKTSYIKSKGRIFMVNKKDYFLIEE